MATQRPTIDALLNLVPDTPETVLTWLERHPDLASQRDRHGYSLLHAATSYEQLDLIKLLIQTYNVDPNLKDEDSETCLFNAESVSIARELVTLGVDINAKNSDGQTAAEKLDDEDEQPEIAACLRDISNRTTGRSEASDPVSAQSSNIPNGVSSAQTNGLINGADRPPPLPSGVEVSLGTMHANEIGGEPDPEFRRRIEELAASGEFDGEEGQSKLRDLISDAVSGLNRDGQPSATRRRLG